MQTQLYLKNSSMYLLPRMKLTFPQQIMGFAAAELHEMPLSPSQATNFFLRMHMGIFLLPLWKRLQNLIEK